jgi:hypothetical protein
LSVATEDSQEEGSVERDTRPAETAVAAAVVVVLGERHLFDHVPVRGQKDSDEDCRTRKVPAGKHEIAVSIVGECRPSWTK